MTSSDNARTWRFATAIYAAAVAALLVVYWRTAASFYGVWRGSDTYTHCFLILPITAVLIWRRRKDLAALEPRPFLPGLLLLAAAGALWLVADAAGVLAYMQLALALLIVGLAPTLFGLRVARVLMFPLAFAMLVVPFGESLHPALMGFTARAAVLGLRMTGVPVAIEGMYLTTPTAHWQVVEACSGLRFLISMFTLGCLFAYLHFHRPLNRILFGALALIFPVLANGLRAYTMVLTGYLGRRELGAGFDHYAIGWTVFAIVMGLFFFLGTRWREEPPTGQEPATVGIDPSAPARKPIIAVVAAVALVVTLAPAALAVWSRPTLTGGEVVLRPPEGAGGWIRIQAPPSSWAPGFHGVDAFSRAVYERDEGLVECYVGYYRQQAQGREMIHFENVIVPREDPRWQIIAERDTSLHAAAITLPVHETLVRSPALRYGVWHWYWLPDEFTGSRSRAKLLQARSRLLWRRDHAAVVILSAPYVSDPARARARLAGFTQAMLPSIRRVIREADSLP